MLQRSDVRAPAVEPPKVTCTSSKPGPFLVSPWTDMVEPGSLRALLLDSQPWRERYGGSIDVRDEEAAGSTELAEVRHDFDGPGQGG